MGIVRIEYEPNRSSRIAQHEGKEGSKPEEMQHDRRVCPQDPLESTTTTIHGPFSFSSLPGKVDQRKVACFYPGLMAAYVVVGLPTRISSWSKSSFTSKGAESKKTCAKDVFFSAFSSPKAKALVFVHHS
ncbi:hypothetical protein Leryth_023261 [Lithospermum erythrorhizon]|nr:hypothetical protein Leryth_023261 [Lithospermum erythrorhizon]